jgi:hypothetical protein
MAAVAAGEGGAERAIKAGAMVAHAVVTGMKEAV